MRGLKKLLGAVLGLNIIFIVAHFAFFKYNLSPASPSTRGGSNLNKQVNAHQVAAFDETASDEKKILLEQTSELQNRLTNLRKETNQLQKAKSSLQHEIAESIGVKETVNAKKENRISFQELLSRDIFAALGAYPDVSYIFDYSVNYTKPHLGIRNDDNYCMKADRYNLDHPDNMLVNKSFFTDYPEGTLPRERIMKKIGSLVMPQISTPMKDFDLAKYPLSPKINNYFTNFKGAMEASHKIGSHFMCATQMYNHIPGHGNLIRKDSILDSFNNYVEKFTDKPQCFNKTMYFPKFYRLYDLEECKAFFRMINSKEYNESLKTEPIQYLIKIGRGSHKGQGVFLLDRAEAAKLNKDYNYGIKCGKIKRSLIAQSYITNPLLLDMKNKFDFRLYVLIASTNPLIVYYHDGFLRVSLSAFNKASGDKATHLTNTFLANQKIADAEKNHVKINNMTQKELEEYHLWTFEKLQDYLLKSGKIQDKNWLNNYLRPAFHKSINHIVKMTSAKYLNNSNVYELLGFDFILDNNMDLFFIEANPSPLLTGTTKHMIYYETVKDCFEIMYAYYRGRMARFLKLINKMKEASAAEGSVDLTYWQGEYQKAAKNRLEPEYKISKKNSFQLIMDENLPGAKAYFGLFNEECLV